MIATPAAGVLTAAITLSMLLTPLLILVADRWWIPLPERRAPRRDVESSNEPQDAPVIVAGFGRYGQIVAAPAARQRHPATVLEHDAEQIEALRKFGFRVHYGDATRLDLLRIAGAARRACWSSRSTTSSRASSSWTSRARTSRPDDRRARPQRAALVPAQRTRRAAHRARDAGLGADERAQRARGMGFEPHRARTLAMRFRRHSVAQLARMAPHCRDESTLISLARAGRQQLEQLFAQERQQAAERQARAGWSGAADAP